MVVWPAGDAAEGWAGGGQQIGTNDEAQRMIMSVWARQQARGQPCTMSCSRRQWERAGWGYDAGNLTCGAWCAGIC